MLMTRNNTDKLLLLISELESLSADFRTKEETISAASIGWHIEHSLLVLNGVVEAMKTSDPEKFKRKFSLAKLYIFTIGRIPKGKGRSPKSVTPSEQVDQSSFLKQLEISKKNIDTLNDLGKNMFFAHPVFGHLRKHRTIYFLELHTEHHLKIIRAIRSAAVEHST